MKSSRLQIVVALLAALLISTRYSEIVQAWQRNTLAREVAVSIVGVQHRRAINHTDVAQAIEACNSNRARRTSLSVLRWPVTNRLQQLQALDAAWHGCYLQIDWSRLGPRGLMPALMQSTTYSMAKAYWQYGHDQLAIELLRGIPDSWRWLEYPGYMHALYGRWDDALIWFDRALALSDQIPSGEGSRLYRYACIAQRRAGQLADALDSCTKYRMLAGPSADAEHLLGTVYLNQGQPVQAEQHISRALAALPSSYEYNLDMGRVSWALGDRATAKRYFLITLRLHPSHTWAHLLIGELLLDDGDDAEALRHFEYILTHSRHTYLLAHAHLYIGLILLNQDLCDQAESHLRQAALSGISTIQARAREQLKRCDGTR